MISRPQKQQGVALIMVLLVVALVSTLAVTMGGRLQLQILRTQNLQDSEQAYWYLHSAEALVKQVLVMELEQSDGEVNLGQNWAQQNSVFPVEGGTIEGRISDLRSCLNVNALDASSSNATANSQERRKEQFKNLFLALQIDDYNADVMVDSIVDWIDRDTNISGTYGAEDPDYESLPTPYRTANAPLAHISELRLIRGFTREIYQKVLPFVCAIPANSDGQVNINTVQQPEVLTALFGGRLALSEAAELIEQRPENGYNKITDFSENSAVQAALQNESGEAQEAGEQQTALDDLRLTSEYFELRGRVRFGQLSQTATSIINVDGSEVTVLYRGMH
ncbi:type II secretion system protein K (GspK) [Pseudidiomarina planktonica]|uniref:Type II secretion system protein K n=1 Tax=Pseudidiomarina planktonica TaxID=1323738 RepID=A0A1Y6EM74_9GAMM|nr:type II secretion system minor pseudopilin GspK [Pseudidiomarina planktonica]RUO65945.1 type II secretory pathway protein [Pseudidiomarina planktonica]SMQ61622.1 type II secretion system protein K (GspK) [Pseudidiomarina planktonica]